MTGVYVTTVYELFCCWGREQRKRGGESHKTGMKLKLYKNH
jgi:hypothetical protein